MGGAAGVGDGVGVGVGEGVETARPIWHQQTQSSPPSAGTLTVPIETSQGKLAAAAGVGRDMNCGGFKYE